LFVFQEQQFLFMEITMKALKKKTNNILAAHFVSSVGTTGDEKALEQLQALFQVAKGPSSVIIANYGEKLHIYFIEFLRIDLQVLVMH
jgi:hypothetical protein